MAKFLFLWTIIWREAGTLSRIVTGFVFSGPTVAALVTGYFGWSFIFPWWVWALIATAVAVIIVVRQLLERAYSLAKELEPKLIISDPKSYCDIWRGISETDKNLKHFYITITNISSGHIKGCSVKEISFVNALGRTASESGRYFRLKIEAKADSDQHSFERQFDLHGKGDHVDIEICCMDERNESARVFMTYATTPTHLLPNSIPKTFFPHKLTISVTAENLPVPVERTFIIDVTPDGYLNVEAQVNV